MRWLTWKLDATWSLSPRHSSNEEHRLHGDAFADFTAWAQQDAGVFDRIRRLILETLREPFIGIGKPEPLKHEFKGCWSRGITGEHRLVYRVTADAIIILACKYHY